MQENRIGIVGSGSWATAMIKMLGDNTVVKDIYWWVRKEEDIAYIKKHHKNPSYLSAVELKIDVQHIYSDVKKVIAASNIIILNTPAAYLKQALRDVRPEDFAGKIIVSAIKGIVPEDNLIIGEYLQEVFAVPLENILVVGGPCHAEEVSLEKLSYLTFGSKSQENAARVAALMSGRYIKTIVSNDVFGIEYGSVLKNIYALAGGICHSLGYGDNFQAVLISNAIREMSTYVEIIDPDNDRDINRSAYLGDLLVTAYSQFSRNRTFGAMIGKGYSVQSAQLEMNMVAEGYYASACIQKYMEKYAINLPICDAVYQILYKQKPASLIISELADKLS